jgi:hypothetical protein
MTKETNGVKRFGIIASVLIALISCVWALSATVNNNKLRIEDIRLMQQEYVRKDVFDANWQGLNGRLTAMQEQLNEIKKIVSQKNR